MRVCAAISRSRAASRLSPVPICPAKPRFLRTVGINLVLARAGSFAVAQSLTFSQMRVITSMRLTDSLSGRISLFYAEAAPRAADPGRGAGGRQRPLPHRRNLPRHELRGSPGRRARRARAAARPGRVRPHHHTRSRNLRPGRIAAGVRNFSFCETIRGGEMTFSYKLQQGPARTTNGRFLLRQLGILPPEEGEGGAG